MCPAKRFMIARPAPVSHVQATLNIRKVRKSHETFGRFDFIPLFDELCSASHLDIRSFIEVLGPPVERQFVF